MKKVIIFSLVATLAIAQGFGDGFGDKNFKHKSSSGNAYKYDLNDACDKMDYQSDVSSQVKDDIYKKQSQDIQNDRRNGENGGGYKGFYD